MDLFSVYICAWHGLYHELCLRRCDQYDKAKAKV